MAVAVMTALESLLCFFSVGVVSPHLLVHCGNSLVLSRLASAGANGTSLKSHPPVSLGAI